MRYYELDPKGFEGLKGKIVLRTLPLFMLAGGLAVFAGTTSSDAASPIPTIITVLLICGIVGPIGIRRGIRMQREAWMSFRLGISESEVTRLQIRVPPLTIKKDEIWEVREDSRGMTIKTEQRAVTIFIPRALDSYSEVREHLGKWRDVRSAPAKGGLVQQYVAGVAVMAAFVVVMVVNEPVVVVPVGSVLFLALVACYVLIHRNQHVDAKVKRLCWWGILPCLAILGKVVYALLQWIGVTPPLSP